MRRGILFLISGILVVGCGRKAMPSTTTEVRDSVVIQEVERLIKVPVPGETMTFTEYIHCDSITHKPVPMRRNVAKGRARLDVKVEQDGRLTVAGACDSLEMAVVVRDKIIRQMRLEKKSTIRIEYEHKPYWYDLAARWIAGATILIVGGYLFIKLR